MQALGWPGGLSVLVLSVPFMEHSGHRLDNSCHSSHHQHFTSLREGCIGQSQGDWVSSPELGQNEARAWVVGIWLGGPGAQGWGGKALGVCEEALGHPPLEGPAGSLRSPERAPSL